MPARKAAVVVALAVACALPADTSAVAGAWAVTTRSKVGMLAADGRRAAVAAAFLEQRPCIALWEPPARRVKTFDERSCEGIDNTAVDGVALAGRRLAWIASMQTLH